MTRCLGLDGNRAGNSSGTCEIHHIAAVNPRLCPRPTPPSSLWVTPAPSGCTAGKRRRTSSIDSSFVSHAVCIAGERSAENAEQDHRGEGWSCGGRAAVCLVRTARPPCFFSSEIGIKLRDPGFPAHRLHRGQGHPTAVLLQALPACARQDRGHERERRVCRDVPALGRLGFELNKWLAHVLGRDWMSLETMRPGQTRIRSGARGRPL
ncbi:hypothetical protein B0H15DRAFT_89820 [Mycena belliarum]|uniref:Uncharacterized protein n=1 Tax=Mycena belliarum TaxID=1033014 RepID=A0AAD6XLC2_9AGAR|nr:hypothetical protein B0H15DRAFT_89820 [Mycena belliae]